MLNNKMNNIAHNGTDIMDDDSLAVFSNYVEGYILTPVSILGIIGNISSILILCSKELRNEFSTLLTALSSFDSLYLLMAILLFGFPEINGSFANYVLPRIMPFGYGILHIGRVGSVMSTLSVAFERFLAIKYPLIVHERAKTLVSSCVVFTILYDIPRFFEFQTVYHYGNLRNSSVKMSPSNSEQAYSFSPTELRLDPIYVQVYVVWMKLIFIEFIPYLAILFFNVVIFLEVQKSAKQQRENYQITYDDSRQNEVRKASVLIWISVFFIVCQSVKVIPDFYEALYCTHKKDYICDSTATIEVLISVSNLSVVVNSSINFVIYIWRGSEFRKVFKQRFQCNRCNAANKSTFCTIGLKLSRNWISSNDDHENDEFVPKDIIHGSIRTTVVDETQL